MNGQINEIDNYMKLATFKDHLKLATNVIIDDIFHNY